MRIRLTSLRRHRWLATLVVLAFALRALIPAGFMPGGSGALTLQICPDGFPQALLASAVSDSAHAERAHHHHHAADAEAASTSADTPAHDHQSWSGHHCVFSAVAGASPLSHLPAVAAVAELEADRVDVYVVPVSFDLRFRIAQPRAPPRLV